MSSWNHDLVEQLDWHWEHHARPRLEGLTDDEYLWEPAADTWSIRPRAEAVARPVGRGDGEHGLARPCGPAEGPYAEHPLSALVLHINREAIHHLAEIALLRDLYVRWAEPAEARS